MEQAFAESQEMVVFVTELTVNPASHQFLTENGCERYFKYNKDLLLDHRKAALQQGVVPRRPPWGGAGIEDRKHFETPTLLRHRNKQEKEHTAHLPMFCLAW